MWGELSSLNRSQFPERRYGSRRAVIPALVSSTIRKRSSPWRSVSSRPPQVELAPPSGSARSSSPWIASKFPMRSRARHDGPAAHGHCATFISNQPHGEAGHGEPRVTSPSIIVVGAEGSGTTLLWQCIVRHPQLQAMTAERAPAKTGPLPADDVILHLSLPTLRPMRWVGGWAAPRGVRVIVLRRSPVHTVFSSYRRFYRQPRAAWRNYVRACALETSWIA